MTRVVFCCAAFLVMGCSLFAQGTRSHVNKGVTLYKDGKYVDSEVEFKKGLDKSPQNFQANFNLGDSYYKEGRYSDALRSYDAALSKANSDQLKSRVYYNMGNSLLKDNKIKESIGAYINSLKLNPNDQEAKYNLSYALDMLKNQNQQQKKNKDKQNQNKDNQNNKQNNPNQQQNKNDKQNQQQNSQSQMQAGKISKDQAEAILSALNNDEKNLQKQLRKAKAQPVKTDKDW